MDTLNSIKTRSTEANDALIASTSKPSSIRLDTTLDNYLDIGKNSSRCSVHRWLGIESERYTNYCSSFNFNMCVLSYRTFHQVPEFINKNCIKT